MKTENTTKSEIKKEEPAYHFVRRIGQTTYRVNVHFSETSKETVEDKILRMLRNDVEQMWRDKKILDK